MNPLVQEMLSNRAGQDVELRFLEDLLNDDCKCGSTHRKAGNPCSFDVVGRKSVKCTGLAFNICQNSWNYNAQYLAEGRWHCPKCGSNLKDCWEIRPI